MQQRREVKSFVKLQRMKLLLYLTNKVLISTHSTNCQRQMIGTILDHTLIVFIKSKLYLGRFASLCNFLILFHEIFAGSFIGELSPISVILETRLSLTFSLNYLRTWFS